MYFALRRQISSHVTCHFATPISLLVSSCVSSVHVFSSFRFRRTKDLKLSGRHVDNPLCGLFDISGFSILAHVDMTGDQFIYFLDRLQLGQYGRLFWRATVMAFKILRNFPLQMNCTIVEILSKN